MPTPIVMSITAASSPHPESDLKASEGALHGWFHRPSVRRKLKRVGVAILLSPVILYVAYVVLANIMLATGLVAKLASYNPEEAELHYDSAWTPWPGRVYVKG